MVSPPGKALSVHSPASASAAVQNLSRCSFRRACIAWEVDVTRRPGEASSTPTAALALAARVVKARSIDLFLATVPQGSKPWPVAALKSR
ncbi:hypothetical protein D3C79_1007370 [compost metagenome]